MPFIFLKKNNFLSQGRLKTASGAHFKKHDFFQPGLLTLVQEILMKPCDRHPAGENLLSGGNTFGSLKTEFLPPKYFLHAKILF